MVASAGDRLDVRAATVADALDQHRRRTGWRLVIALYRRDVLGMAGLAILLAIAALGILAPVIAEYPGAYGEFEAINLALVGIPADRVRLHVCWGNGEWPHVRDIPLAAIVDLLFEVRAEGLSVEGANPRHGHEWRVFEEHKLPEGKVLIPGVIDTLTNFVEHPDLVAATASVARRRYRRAHGEHRDRSEGPRYSDSLEHVCLLSLTQPPARRPPTLPPYSGAIAAAIRELAKIGPVAGQWRGPLTPRRQVESLGPAGRGSGVTRGGQRESTHRHHGGGRNEG